MRFVEPLALFSLLIPLYVQAQQSDLDLIASRRKSDLAQTVGQNDIGNIPGWLATQSSEGIWSDVDYTSGCDAQRANWPIQAHWLRVIAFASAWSGLNPASPPSYSAAPEVLDAALKGLDWWFERDFTSMDCIGQGGLANATCLCGTQGLWNTNWFDQIILIPQLASTACLLLSSANLTDAERKGCYDIPYRAYALRDDFINGLGYLTGANVMQNSASFALYNNNATVLEDAFARAMAVVTFSDAPAQDGIHRDGSFLQHNGILYNGNYGKDLINAFIQLEGEAKGTAYAANDTTRQAFSTDLMGSEWMIYVDKQTRQEHWDLNVVGRFIAFPTTDLQANADINFNVKKLSTAVDDFSGADSLGYTVRRLESNGTEKLLGNKGFWASDYMVHRRENYILTNKMISNRSHNTEYTNSANPFGYHLGQGTLFSYVNGYEYRDIQDAWDWNLIPGTTVLLDQPKLNSSYAGVTGTQAFVGMVSDGWVGTTVEDYIDPHDASLSYRKVWFFLDDSVLITTSNVVTNTTSNAPVIMVLDNRLSNTGGIRVDGKILDASSVVDTSGHTLYYGGNGYLSFDTPFNLTLSESDRTGNWSAISTSTKGNTTVPIFSAYTTIPLDTYSYAFFPASTLDRLSEELADPTITPLEMNGTLGAAGAERLSLVFWPDSGTSVTVPLSTIGWASNGEFTVTTSDPAAYLFATRYNPDDTRTLVVTLADPSQSLTALRFTLHISRGSLQCTRTNWNDGCLAESQSVSFDVDLPSGGLAGSSVFREVALLR